MTVHQISVHGLSLSVRHEWGESVIDPPELEILDATIADPTELGGWCLWDELYDRGLEVKEGVVIPPHLLFLLQTNGWIVELACAACDDQIRETMREDLLA